MAESEGNMMLTEQRARRLLALKQAERDLPELRTALRRRKPRGGYTSRVMEISVCDDSEAGGETDASVMLDLDSADLLFQILQDFIREQLQIVQSARRTKL
ncbi:MAG: hypothetical protein ACREQF_07955 [Candidatus Binataceae bacterium]